MAYSKPIHVECYKVDHYNKPAGRPAKYDGRCMRGEKCLRGGMIRMGENITFLRFRGKKPAYNAPTPSIEEAEEDTGTDAAEVDVAAKVSASLGADPVSAALAAILLPLMARDVDAKLNDKLSKVDPEAILAEVDEAIAARIDALKVPRELVLTTPTIEAKNVGHQHKQFEVLLKAIASGCNVWLAGPSGSGKSTAAINAAEALGLKFFFTGAVGDQYALIGYNDVQGRYVQTPFRQAWENGGVFLWDEIDASDPSALVAFNAALANDVMAFPDAIVKKHPDCRIIAAANTWGHGATHEYVGRMKLDMAFIKRFVFLAWDYDDELELVSAPNPTWTKRVQEVRAKVRAKGIRVLVTPRESYFGARLLAAGIEQATVEAMTIKSGMTDEQWRQVCN